VLLRAEDWKLLLQIMCKGPISCEQFNEITHLKVRDIVVFYFIDNYCVNDCK
jgi:hypothetical protein